MKLTNLLRSFSVVANEYSKVYYSFGRSNTSGKTEIDLIRSNLYPIVGNSDNNVIKHVIQSYLFDSVPYTIDKLLHIYQLDYNPGTPFVNDFIKLNKVQRETVIENMNKRNMVRYMAIQLNKLNLNPYKHSILLNQCDIQLKQIELLHEKINNEN